jgi:hypothetical protein
MDLSKVSKEDKIHCADLLNMVQNCDLTIKGNELARLRDAVVWLQSLAKQMLSPEEKAKPSGLSNVKVTNPVKSASPKAKGKK